MFPVLAQKIVRQRRDISNGQFTNLAAANSLSFFDRGIAIFEDLSGVNQERFTCRRERHSLALSLEQIYPQFAFQFVDLLAERGLRNVNFRAGLMARMPFSVSQENIIRTAAMCCLIVAAEPGCCSM
jgi:hypothetical protein